MNRELALWIHRIDEIFHKNNTLNINNLQGMLPEIKTSKNFLTAFGIFCACKFLLPIVLYISLQINLTFLNLDQKCS